MFLTLLMSLLHSERLLNFFVKPGSMATGFMTSRSRRPPLDVTGNHSVNIDLLGPEHIDWLTLNRVLARLLHHILKRKQGLALSLPEHSLQVTSCSVLPWLPPWTGLSSCYLLNQNRRRLSKKFPFKKAWSRTQALGSVWEAAARLTCFCWVIVFIF